MGIDLVMGQVEVAFDVVQIHRFRDARLPMEIEEVNVEIPVIDDATEIAFEKPTRLSKTSPRPRPTKMSTPESPTGGRRPPSRTPAGGVRGSPLIRSFVGLSGGPTGVGAFGEFLHRHLAEGVEVIGFPVTRMAMVL